MIEFVLTLGFLPLVAMATTFGVCAVRNLFRTPAPSRGLVTELLTAYRDALRGQADAIVEADRLRRLIREARDAYWAGRHEHVADVPRVMSVLSEALGEADRCRECGGNGCVGCLFVGWHDARPDAAGLARPPADTPPS